jgi:asparagine synthase (glutamine-hydrolysing)
MRTDQLAICEQFTELLSDAVRISMRSDVPFGAFLSGGLDSACIVTLMARQTPLPVRTFTIGFNESDYDDRELARLVAARMHTAHYEQAVEPDDLERALNEVCLHYDEPFGDSSALPTGHVARLARNHVKMVLTGDGGDEVLSGYTGYLVEKFASVYRRIPALARHTAESALAAVARAARGRIRYGLNRYERMLRTANVDFATRLVSKAAWLDRQTRAAILGGIQTMPVDQVIAEHMKSCPWNDSFYQLMYFNYKISLPDDMLTKVDRMTMAHSLEARVPFLDYRLVELMAQVHKNIKMQGLERKSVLRRTVGRELPPPLLQAPKRGFVAPLGSWFQNKEVTAPLNSRELSQWGMSESAIDLVVAQHRSGQHDHGNAIWMLMVLQKVLAVAPT